MTADQLTCRRLELVAYSALVVFALNILVSLQVAFYPVSADLGRSRASRGMKSYIGGAPSSNSTDPVSNKSSSSKAYIEGDLILGGLFPVHSTTGDLNYCSVLQHDRGIERMEAMLYTIDEINKNESLLPGITLGASIYDTCGMATYALEQSLEFIRGSITTLDFAELVCEDGSQAKPRHPGLTVAGVIGGSYSSVSIQVANLLRLFKVPQISYASTSASLSDKSRYDYFLRTVPSDILQSMAIADLVQAFNWTYVSTIQSKGEYGKSGIDYFKQEARAKNICIAAAVEIEEKATDKSYDKAIAEILDKEEASVVIAFIRIEDAAGLLKAATRRRIRRRLVVIASDSWGNRLAPVHNNEQIAQGTITLELQSTPIPDFEKYFLALRPQNNTRNPWYKEYWEEVHNCRWFPGTSGLPQCTGDEEVSRKVENQESKIQFVYDAVYALAIALHQMQRDVCGINSTGVCDGMKTIDGQKLLTKYLLNISFPDGYGARVRFDDRGDSPGRYTIMNYQQNRTTREFEYKVVGTWEDGELSLDLDSFVWAGGTTDIPRSRCSEPCKEGEIINMQKGEQCCWICTKCSPWEYIKDEKTCERCEIGFWPYADKSGCFSLEVQHMTWGSIYAIVPMVLAGLGICTTVFVIIVFIVFNDTPMVMASGRELSYMLLSGCLFCYCMTFILLAPPSVVVCGFQRFGVGWGFCVVYASLLVKTNRISRIFESARRTAKRPPFISPRSQIMMSSVLIVVQVLCTSVWLLVEPPGTGLFLPDYREPVIFLICAGEDISILVSLVYNMLLIIVCTVYAVKTRKIPENFNESKFIGFSMYTTCIIWLAFVPLYFGTEGSFMIQVTTLCVSISLSASVAVMCLFMPKMYIILFQPHKNLRQLTMTNKANLSSPSITTNVINLSVHIPISTPETSRETTAVHIPISTPETSSETTAGIRSDSVQRNVKPTVVQCNADCDRDSLASV